jgi:RNA polymerase sigma factor (sigma-70 family)
MTGRAPDAEDLAEFARSGSAEAFARLSRRYAGLVYRTCLRRLNSAADAEDAAQAVFVALSRKAGGVKPAKLASWLHGASIRAARFIARSRANRARYEKEAARMKSAETEQREVPDREVLAHLDAEVERLPSRLREAVTRHYLAGLSRAELARELGVPEGTVQSRLNAGLEKLRARLGGRAVRLGAAALAGLLASEAQAGAPASLIASLPTLVAGSAAAGAAAGLPGVAVGAKTGAGAGVSLIAEGVIKAMLWTKIKIAVAAVAAVTVVAGVGTPLTVRAVAGGKKAPAVGARESAIRARVVKVVEQFKKNPGDPLPMPAGYFEVTVDAGSSQGVRKGFVFHFERDGKQLGQSGPVTRVEKNRSVMLAGWTVGPLRQLLKVGDVAVGKFTVVDPEKRTGPPVTAAVPDLPGVVYVKMLCGADKLFKRQERTEEWIIRETAGLGSPTASENTGWMELAGTRKRIYASRMGGRLVEGRVTGRGKQVVIRFTGRRTDKLPLTVHLPDRAGARKVVKITSYPGARNHFLAIKVGAAAEAVNGLRLTLAPTWEITLRGGSKVTLESGHSWRPPGVILCEVLEERADSYRIFAYSGKRWKATVKKADVAGKRARLDWAKLRWENVGKKPLVVTRDRCCDLYDHVFMKGPGGKLVPARTDNRGRKQHAPPQLVRIEPGKRDEERFDPWHWVQKPARPGEYTLWVEFEIKGVPPRSKVPGALRGAREWTGKVRSNAVKVVVPVGALEAAKLAGIRAALALAERGKKQVREYLVSKRDRPAVPWVPRKVDLKSLNLPGAEDAVVLYGGVVVARSSTKVSAIAGRAEPGRDPRVEVLRGVLRRGDLRIPCYQFKVPIRIEGSRVHASLRLIVRMPGAAARKVKAPERPANPIKNPADPEEVF